MDLALITIAIVMALMIPTMLAIHLRLPRARPIVETICMVPLVISPVALVAGVSTVLGWGLDTARYVDLPARRAACRTSRCR